MSSALHRRGMRPLLAAASCCAIAVAALAADSGQAQNAGKTLTITWRAGNDAALDVAPKGVERGRVGLGDQFFVGGAIRRSDGATGTLAATFTVGNAHTVPIAKSVGTFVGAYHFADGDILFQAFGTFDDVDIDHGAIIGGTGAYAGAQGTFDSKNTKSNETVDTVHLTS
jgi:hypothetical protein